MNSQGQISARWGWKQKLKSPSKIIFKKKVFSFEYLASYYLLVH